MAHVIAVVVYAGWPSEDGSHWLDVDGEGGFWSPGFVAVFEDGPADEPTIRAEILRRLNAKYAAGWPEAGIPPLRWSLEHFDTDPADERRAPFIQAQWERVALERLSQ